MTSRRLVAWLLLLAASLAGCRSLSSRVTRHKIEPDAATQQVDATLQAKTERAALGADKPTPPSNDHSLDEPSEVQTVSASGSPIPTTDEQTADDQSAPAVEDAAMQSLQLNAVHQSIYASYPLLQIAIYGRNIAAGEQLSAEGAWDLKLKADANNAPVGFYKTYRNGAGFEQPLYGGGEVFGLYKVGQGNFEPWYGNRQTNDGGEFSAGIRLPLAQNRMIDERRATFWKANYGVGAIEPVIQAQIIEFIRAGSYAYWDWVAAGLNLRISRELLNLAQQRDTQIEGQVKVGARPESMLIDNHRLIVSRQVKLIEAQRKLQTTAIKLSLFLRTTDGQPIVPTEQQLPTGFPPAEEIDSNKIPFDISEAIVRRPELRELDFQHRMAQVDLQQAQNLTQPEIDATIWSAKDVGGWASPKGDKTPFQTEAGLNFSVPLQRRKARGKIAAVEGKLVQIATKRQFAENKITTEVQSSVVTISAAYRSIDKARESVRLNEQMQKFEAVKLENGDSDLLLLNLREAATFDARVVEIEALLHYFESLADYRAALALDIAEFDPSQNGPPP